MKKLRVVALKSFQSEEQIAALVEFSNEHWEYGGWDAEAFGEDDIFPFKLELSCVLADVNDKVFGVFIVSQQKERYLESTLDEYLYIHKILIDPSMRGFKIDGRSLFGTMWDFSVDKSVEDFDLYSQLLTVDDDNLNAISIYERYGFCYMGDRSDGKILMGRGFLD